MMKKKFLIILLVFLVGANLLFSQSLVELSKKEKQRRAKYKEKKVVKITNADLKEINKNPALIVQSPLLASRPKINLTPPPSWLPSPKKERENLEKFRELKEKLQKSKEKIELLTLKINSLRQKFYTFRDWTLRRDIKKEISQTFQKLQQAKQEKEETEEKLIPYGNIQKH